MQRRFPATRPRRSRFHQSVRNLVAETQLSPDNLILPIFLTAESASAPIKTLPGVDRLSPTDVLKTCEKALALGVKTIAPFPQIADSKKDPLGKEATNAKGLVPSSIKAIKTRFPDITIVADVALDPYTSHGQDGIIDEDGYIVNDKTVASLVDQAEVLASAGADIVAPSDMMDGRIGAIRQRLEDKDFTNTLILSYAAKYASSFYGPFRKAIASATNLGKKDKTTYQMDFRNSEEALLEAELDLTEGADLLMVKPAMPYLDIVRRLKEAFQVPVLAYQVSGEYAMIAFASQNDAIDRDNAVLESLYSIKRAGATGILTYFALEAATHLNQQ